MQTLISPAASSPPAGVVLADARGRVRESLAQTIRHQTDMRVLAEYETTQETWRCLRQRRPEVLLLDWRLPDAGGMALLRRLSPGPSLRVILLTEERSPELLAETMILGARGAISRTARPETVLRCARAVLGGELWFPRSATRALRDRIVSGLPSAGTPGEPSLTPRELDVTRGVARGRTNIEIAGELGISSLTVRHHLKSVFGKLHVTSRLELAVLAIRSRL